jgi:chemotaxis protein methyltransferase CheR
MSKIDPQTVVYFAQLIEKEIGIQYNSVNSHMLENRLHDLAKSLGFSDFESFWSDLKNRTLRPSEKEAILDIATNNETSFFRDVEIFDFFENDFLPKQTSSPLRVWCAASSTGQEPYSLAMVLAQLKDAGQARRYEILATDFSERVLKQAQSGLYSQLEVQRGLSPAMLARFFEPNPGEKPTSSRFKIKPELSSSITFKRLNLLDPWSHRDPFHIIFCRNVLIYQDVENKRKVIARLSSALTPGGYLVLGGAESLMGLSQDFEMQIFGKACVYKLKPNLKASA